MKGTPIAKINAPGISKNARIRWDTNKNPIGIYMLDEIKIPDGHDKRGYRLLSDRNCKYNDYLDVALYHTLLIMDKKWFYKIII